ncbi:MAG TPA: hypothetical protein VIC84_02545 [Blastocatellia bacterium]|jgi:hypothetical protein
MNRMMNFLISALFTLIVSSAVMAQTPAPRPGPGVYTPNGGGVAPSVTSPGLNGTYQPGVMTTQPPPPAPGSGAYMPLSGGALPPPTPTGLNQPYQMNGTYQPGVITTQPPAPGPGVFTPNGGGIAPSATSPGLNGTYQPGVMTTQPPPPAPGSGAYMPLSGGALTPPTPIGANQPYQMNGAYQPGVITTQPPSTLGTGAYTTGLGVIPGATSPGMNGTYQMNTQGAGAVSGTAYRSTTYNTNASGGQVGGGQLLTGPDVSTGTAPTTRANNGSGSSTRNRSLTGLGGAPSSQTSSQTTTVGSGANPTYGRTQSGPTYSGAQSGSTYNGTQSSSTYGASRRP